MGNEAIDALGGDLHEHVEVGHPVAGGGNLADHLKTGNEADFDGLSDFPFLLVGHLGLHRLVASMDRH